MNEKGERIIGIDDIKLAAYLHYKSFKIRRIVKSGRFSCFYFAGDQAKKEIDNYMLGSSSVEPKQYSACIRELRAMSDTADLSNVMEKNASGQTR